jgi:hypothetical protein
MLRVSCGSTDSPGVRPGCVVKLAGHDRELHEGPARVFDGEEVAFAAIAAGGVSPGGLVVIRNEGPRGGLGMREMLQVTGAAATSSVRPGGHDKGEAHSQGTGTRRSASSPG